MLGISPAVGRSFTLEEDTVVIPSDGLWHRRFSAGAALIGKTVLLNGHTVVGVMPKQFRFLPQASYRRGG